MRNLLWFRAFNRSTIQDLLDVLRDGDTPHPDPTKATRRHEVELGIAPPCVYAYLGLTLEEFGKSAFALGFDAFSGSVTPFDTGGLVNRIQPVCAWSSEDRRAFLAAHSWPHSELPVLFELFPGMSEERILKYLEGVRPEGDGFHALLADLPEAPIWRDNDDRRAWVWEGRRPERLPVGDSLIAWTCPPELYEDLLAQATSTPEHREWYLRLARRHVRGGVTALLRELRARQEAA